MKATERELVITRVFDAPRERVWKAWTDPEEIKRWWGPKNYTVPFMKIDFRVGGKYFHDMRSPEGKDYWSTGFYREIVPPERIVATNSFADEKGNIVPASYYDMPGDWAKELLVTISFEEADGKTKMTLRQEGIPLEARKDVETGWNESFDKLAKILK